MLINVAVAQNVVQTIESYSETLVHSDSGTSSIAAAMASLTRSSDKWHHVYGISVTLTHVWWSQCKYCHFSSGWNDNSTHPFVMGTMTPLLQVS